MQGDARPSAAPNAYDGVESIQRFSTDAELDEYRRGLLEKAEVETGFIKREIGRKDLRVAEVGMGGGRLLIALALAGILRSGAGSDISPTRVEFARRWADDLGLRSLEFVVADALGSNAWPEGEYDLFICISNLIGYLGPVRPDAPADVLRRAYRSLAPDGCLLLEAYQLTTRHRQVLAASDNRFRTWMPLPEWDRFAYYLSDLAYEPSTGVLHHEKTFIGRDGTIDTGRTEENSFCTRDEVLEWLRPEGCERYRAFGSYASEPYSDQSTQMVLLLGGPRWEPPSDEYREGVPTVPRSAIRGVGVGAWC